MLLACLLGCFLCVLWQLCVTVDVVDDEEEFVVRRRLLSPCIALTKWVMAGRGTKYKEVGSAVLMWAVFHYCFYYCFHYCVHYCFQDCFITVSTTVCTTMSTTVVHYCCPLLFSTTVSTTVSTLFQYCS